MPVFHVSHSALKVGRIRKVLSFPHVSHILGCGQGMPKGLYAAGFGMLIIIPSPTIERLVFCARLPKAFTNNNNGGLIFLFFFFSFFERISRNYVFPTQAPNCQKRERQMDSGVHGSVFFFFAAGAVETQPFGRSICCVRKKRNTEGSNVRPCAEGATGVLGVILFSC